MNRREFLSLASAAALGGISRQPLLRRFFAAEDTRCLEQPADFTLHMAPVALDLGSGIQVRTIGYNGTVPGPLLRVKEGVPLKIDVFNETDVPELVHWHGLAIDSANDGAMEEGSPIIPPKGRLRYTFTPRPAGSRWYHTHAAAGRDLTRSTYSGQFGFLYIEPKHDQGAYDREVFLAVHHWEPTLSQIDSATSRCDVTYKYASFNDKVFSAAEPVAVRAGERVLFHFLNASATENVVLALPGHRFKVIALDGNAVPTPKTVSTLALGVAERVDAIVEMNNPGVWILGSTSAQARAMGLGLPIEYASRSGPPAWQDPVSSKWSYQLFGNETQAPAPDEYFPMIFQRVVDQDGASDRWTINGKSFPDIAPLEVREGKRYRLAFFDASGEVHPVHLHRHSFEIVSIAGKATSGVIKDVVSLEPYGRMEVDFIANNPGLTLFHCHQQLHMDSGFMQLIKYA